MAGTCSGLGVEVEALAGNEARTGTIGTAVMIEAVIIGGD